MHYMYLISLNTLNTFNFIKYITFIKCISKFCLICCKNTATHARLDVTSYIYIICIVEDDYISLYVFHQCIDMRDPINNLSIWCIQKKKTKIKSWSSCTLKIWKNYDKLVTIKEMNCTHNHISCLALKVWHWHA